MKVIDLVANIQHGHASVDDTLAMIEELMLDKNAKVVPLLDCLGKLFGFVDAHVVAFAHKSRLSPDSLSTWEICNRAFPVVGPRASLGAALDVINESAHDYIAVLEQGRYLGFLNAIDIVKKIKLLEEDDRHVSAEIDLS